MTLEALKDLLPAPAEGEVVDIPAIYREEIGQIPLLTAQEERFLAQRIQMGRAAQNVLDRFAPINTKCPFIACRLTHPISQEFLQRTDLSAYLRPIPAMKEAIVWGYQVTSYIPPAKANNPEFGLLIDESMRARDKFIEANLRLVISIAKRYTGRGLHQDDLIQEGNLGLMRAVEKFEWQKGFKFSTYATWWIRQGITRAIADQSRTIRLPVHMHEGIQAVSTAINRLSQALGREPTDQEIAEETGLNLDKISAIRHLETSGNPLSLEYPEGDDRDAVLGDFIEDSGNARTDEYAIQEVSRHGIAEVLDTLPIRERKVIELRFGLENGSPMSLAEIGRKFRLSRERIRQIEAKAMRRLRHPSRSRILANYL